MSKPKKEILEITRAVKRGKSRYLETYIPAINGIKTLIAGYLIK